MSAHRFALGRPHFSNPGSGKVKTEHRAESDDFSAFLLERHIAESGASHYTLAADYGLAVSTVRDRIKIARRRRREVGQA